MQTKGKVTEDDYIDVGDRFRGTIEVLFLTHLASVIAAFCLILCSPRVARTIYLTLPNITMTIIALGNLFLFYSRFVHSGRVCSGDYLDR